MAKILIVYYSKTGNTGQMAEFVKGGVEKEGGVQIELKRVEETGIEDLLDPEGILMGSPTYYGTMSIYMLLIMDFLYRLVFRAQNSSTLVPMTRIQTPLNLSRLLWIMKGTRWP